MTSPEPHTPPTDTAGGPATAPAGDTGAGAVAPSSIANPIASSLDALAAWRAELDRQVAQLGRAFVEHELLDDADAALLAALREQLASDKLVLAFVAEFSRGKSELINAIFFADAGRRVLPATPGRTTMCPVELRHDGHLPPRLALLPIETRLRGLSLAELRTRDGHWQHVPLDPADPQSLVQALAAVTRRQRVSVEQATALGFWNAAQPEDNPPQADDGSVEVPAWRHAVINYPHPLLQHGLVVDWILETHAHADHITSAGLLRRRSGALAAAPFNCGVTPADLHLEQGVTLNIGGESLRVLDTPGHTAGSICLLWRDAVFTGDTLLIGGCGRCDFQGGDAGAMYDSISQRLFTLPDETRVYPGHDYRGNRQSTIGAEKRDNPRLAGKTRDQFIALMARLDLPKPAMIDVAVPANRNLGLPQGM